ncbi:histone protein [Streptomyces sp. NPDC002225]|uniref:histone protein n=1 Tax=Streptomyces sp. NPDC002225 TaxID=3154413 RepID=UPI003323F906
MTEVNRLLLAGALAGGYVLGRTKKGRLALTVASYAAGRHFGVEPVKLMSEGARRLGEIPQVADLGDQLRGDLMTAGREAVSAAAGRRLSSFADSLHERTLELEGRNEEEDDEEEEEDRDDEDDIARDEDEDEEEEPDEEPAPEARKRKSHTSGTSGRKSEGRAAGAAGQRKAGGRKQRGAAEKTAPSRKPAAKRKTAGRAAPGKRASAEKTPPHAERRR